MGWFDKRKEKAGAESSPRVATESLLEQALRQLEGGRPERAVALYRQILETVPNATAQYNLASLYAQGRGVEQDFTEAARLFRQAELAGDEQAGKLCRKCLMDFTRQRMNGEGAEALYADVLRFIERVYPEADARQEANRGLFALAGLHFNRREYTPAAKLFRAAAEFGNDGLSQNYLAVLYNLGGGVEKNDLAALYWFDRAVDNGADIARADRDGILNAYRTNFSPEAFRREMTELAEWCAEGTGDIPADARKAAYWRSVAED